MNLADIVVVGLAAARAYQLFAHDTILDSPRSWVDDNMPKVSDWLSCPWCAGFWLALATVGVWHTDFRWVVYLAAVAEVASLAGLFANRLGEHPLTVEIEGTEEEFYTRYEGNGE